MDDFERASDLGPNWTTAYHGDGSGMMQVADAESAPWQRTRGFGMRADGEPATGIQFRTDARGEAVTLVGVQRSLIASYPPPSNFVQFSDGRRAELTDHCAVCSQPWQKNDIAESSGGPFQHRDCNDPRGES